MPFGKGRKNGSDWSGVKNAVLGGWNVNTIFQARTGFPFTVWDGAGQSLQAPRTVERPNTTCSGETNASGPNDTWIDISCFQHAAAGTFGNSGVGILRGPGYWNVDLGISKNFYLDDKRYLTFRAEAFNVFNHPNFQRGPRPCEHGRPGQLREDGGTFSAPRIIELALKLVF